MLCTNTLDAYRANPKTAPTGWVLESNTITYSSALSTLGDFEALPATDISLGQVVVTHNKPLIQILPIIGDGNNETIAFRVYGLRRITNALQTTTPYWTSITLWDGTAAAGNKAYSASGNYRYADTITTGSSPLPSSAYRIVASTDDQAFLEIDTRDFEHIVIIGTLDGQTGAGFLFATSGGTL